MEIGLSGLPAATSVSASDTIAIVQSGVTKKAAVSLLPSGGSGTSGAPNDSTSASAYSLVSNGLWGPGSMVSGSKNLTFPAGGLNSSHVGAYVHVLGAAASGVSHLDTTITSVTNSTTAVLAVAAGTTVSGAQTVLGTDNSTQIINALTAAAGKRLTFPKGTYFVNTVGISIPANTVLDGTGATFLFGGFALNNGVTVQGATFVGDGSGDYYFALSQATTAQNDVNIRDNKFYYHTWSYFTNGSGFNYRWTVQNNVTDHGVVGGGGFELDNLIQSVVNGNRALNCPSNNRPLVFGGTQQRNSITNNYSEGGVTGILFLWDGDYLPAPSATQGIEVCDNFIAGNRIIGQSEEGISLDGLNVQETVTLSAVNTTAKTLTISGTAFNSAAAKYRFYWVYVVNGNGIGQLHRITNMNNAVLTVADADATDLGKIVAGNTVTIVAATHHNIITGNRIDGRLSSTYSIWLYSSCHFNVVSNNVTEGAPIGVAGTNSMSPGTGSVTGLTNSSPSSNNVFSSNVCTNSTFVPSYYGQQPGIHFMYYNFGSQADYYMVGNAAIGNIVRGGQITLQRQEKLLTGNVCDRALVNTSPYGASTNVTGI